MGNKLGRRRHMVDERYTRPQGLYHHKDVDHKKLRKLILDSKLAPCYPGDDDSQHDLEECPICFLYYPSLNRSRCCMKGICTECFLQMKNPDSARPTQCPFCKASNYAVEFRGVKSKEEKGMECIEEQRVIEAKIRIRQKEIEEERMYERHGTSAGRMGHADHDSSSASPVRSSVHDQGSTTSQESGTLVRRPHTRQNREDEFDLDLEEIMVMEAIWLSIQNGTGEAANKVVRGDYAPHVIDESSSSSRSGGLACAIAALAEQQQVEEETFSSYSRNVAARDISPPDIEHVAVLADLSPTAAVGGAGIIAQGSTTRFPSLMGPIIPDSFEEQMMLAMALSLADSRSRISAQGVAWQ